MILRNTIHTLKGEFQVEYHDADSFDGLPIEKCRQAYGICYFQHHIVLCISEHGHFTLPGGTVEPGETLSQTLSREVKEESNMKILKAVPIGYQKCWSKAESPFFQVRYYAQVEPFGPFESDPDGHIKAIKLVNPTEAPDTLQWGQIGDRLFNRAAEQHQLSQVA